MRRTVLPMLVAVLTLVTVGSRPAPVQGEERRIALVVGVSEYRHLPSLPNPANDARAMARALMTAGFDLVGGGPRIDPDRRELEAAIAAFAAHVDPTYGGPVLLRWPWHPDARAQLSGAGRRAAPHRC